MGKSKPVCASCHEPNLELLSRGGRRDVLPGGQGALGRGRPDVGAMWSWSVRRGSSEGLSGPAKPYGVQFKPMRSLAEPLQVAMDNGARKALIPLENKRNFLEVSGDIVERVDTFRPSGEET
jgi:hypothetical protein